MASASSSRPQRPRLSLRGRALALLAQREHSRLELGRKLAPRAESPEQLAALLDEFQRAGYLSDERFAQSLVHRRAQRFGTRRIAQELGQHCLAVEVSRPLLADLQASERDRAQALWQKRFDALAATPAERLRQQRFLAQRGFSPEAIQWVLRRGAAAHPDHELPDQTDFVSERFDVTDD